MREIGSEFWDVPITEKQNSLFPKSTQWFLSGRNALQAIIKELKECHTVAMPSWCCDSMIKPFLEAGVEVHFYPVYWHDGLVQEISLDCDVLLLIGYFGYTSVTPDLSNYKGIIIRDVTHSIFSSSYSDADYYFGSLRKWCGVWTGGYAWKKDGHKMVMENNDDFGYTALREHAMELKNGYINALGVTDKAYLGLFEEAEDALENVGIAPAAVRDVKLANNMDAEIIRSRRRVNAEVLRSKFTDWIMFSKMKDSDCPMFVPILVPNGKRNELRRYLIKHEIYCPIHWPLSEYHKLCEREMIIYDNELSLVCDQRYTEEDMNHMVEIIKNFWKGV